MDELIPAARKLIELVTVEDEPPKQEIDESWGMVVSRVESSRARERPRRILVVAIVGAAVLLGLGLFIAITPARERASVVLIPDVRAPRVAAEAPAAVRRVVDAPAASDHAGLLDEAEAALADDPSRAWTLLLRHAEVASDTASVPRRMALRIRTLCALGRTDEARHETTAFLHRHGDAPQAEDVRAACGVQAAGD